MHPADHPGPLVFVDDLAAPRLLEPDRHHLERVLRLRAGDPLTIADGAGGWRTAVLGADVEPTGPIEHLDPPTPPLAIGVALIKGDKLELVVQKLTELGVERIVPFTAERSVVRWDPARSAKAVVRLRAIARAAAMQCHRPQLPVVEEVAELAAVASRPGTALAARDGGAVSLAHALVLVGPEGGWSRTELDAGLPRVALGPHVLRAETAAIAAGALLTGLRARVVGDANPQVT